MSILDHLTSLTSAIARTASHPEGVGYGPALALGHPDRGKGWSRPWGRIETAMVSTRTSRRTLSVQTAERHIAILTTDGLTPELLASRTWHRARNFRRGRITDAFAFPFAGVLVLGALLLGTVLHMLASLLAVTLLLMLAIAAGITGTLRYRSAAEQANTELTAAGHDWREIELGEDDALAHLVRSLDALAYSWEHENVADDVWATARTLTFAVTDEALRGALIDDDNHELRTARDYIAAAREAIATTGRVDQLATPFPKTA